MPPPHVGGEKKKGTRRTRRIRGAIGDMPADLQGPPGAGIVAIPAGYLCATGELRNQPVGASVSVEPVLEILLVAADFL